MKLLYDLSYKLTGDLKALLALCDTSLCAGCVEKVNIILSSPGDLRLRMTLHKARQAHAEANVCGHV